ncbi:tyrosinase family protein [Streptomyces sp. 5.8]|uniref:tyrosinase family protein n=1 Tax=Streptomyces sp. 5.8 TaxID=3406571 RepID=UPI003BB6CDBA
MLSRRSRWGTHVHGGPEFLLWHREIVNRFEDQLRVIDSRVSQHYWDWTQDPRSIPSANLGNGNSGSLNLFTPEFMGYGGQALQLIGQPFEGAGFCDPQANPFRSDNAFDPNNNPADKPRAVRRQVNGLPIDPVRDQNALAADDYADMRVLIEDSHNEMHGFNADIEPWATGSTNRVRPWGGPENLGIPYKDLSVVIPRRYDTNPDVV